MPERSTTDDGSTPQTIDEFLEIVFPDDFDFAAARITAGLPPKMSAPNGARPEPEPEPEPEPDQTPEPRPRAQNGTHSPGDGSADYNGWGGSREAPQGHQEPVEEDETDPPLIDIGDPGEEEKPDADEFSEDPEREQRLAALDRLIIRSNEPERIIPPSWLIDEVLEDRKLNLIVGAPNHGKSFLAIDICCRTVLEMDWCGYEISRDGPVIYLAAEGWPGLFYRKAAWEAYYGRSVEGRIQFLPLPVPVVKRARGGDLEISREWDDLCYLLARKRPAAVWADTKGRLANKANPDRPEDAEPVVQGFEQLVEAAAASVNVLDHSPRGALRPRGDQLFEGSAASVLTMEKFSRLNHPTADDLHIRIYNYRQRDGRQQDPLDFSLRDIQVEGRKKKDAVLVPGTPDWAEKRKFEVKTNPDGSVEAELPGLVLINDHFEDGREFSGDDLATAGTVTVRTARRWLSDLTEDDDSPVLQIKRGREVRYRLRNVTK